MKDFYELLDLYRSVGAEVIITMWRFAPWLEDWKNGKIRTCPG